MCSILVLVTLLCNHYPENMRSAPRTGARTSMPRRTVDPVERFGRRAARAVVPVLASAGLLVGVAWALGGAPLIGRGGVDGPVSTSDHPGLFRSGNDAVVAGRVDVRGGCTLLTSAGRSHAVLWPHGTSWDHEAGAVRLAHGVLVRAGGHVDGGGGYLPVGDALGAGARAQPEVLDELARCSEVVGTSEVAVFNPGSDVTG
jgi:hypothetical protein